MQRECGDIIERLATLRTSMAEHERAKEMKRRDAARKRAKYAADRNVNGAGIASVDGCSVEEPPNRSRRCVETLVAKVVADLMTQLANYNVAARKLALQRLWLQRDLRVYQPSRLGCPKLDLSLHAAVNDLSNTLQLVKQPRRKDHLCTKRAVLTSLVGKNVVENRFQSTFAKVLGIKRQNVHRASKVRQLIDSDSSKKYPMGERQVRCDKISVAVRKVVEMYWKVIHGYLLVQNTLQD
jgi:hypothetical protein